MKKVAYLLAVMVFLCLAGCHPDGVLTFITQEAHELNQNPLVVDIEQHQHGGVESSSHAHNQGHKGCKCGHHAKAAVQPGELIPIEKQEDKHQCESCKKGGEHCTCSHKHDPKPTHTHNFATKAEPQTCNNCGKGQCSCQSDTSNPSLLPPRSHTCKNCKDGNCDRCERAHPPQSNG